MTWEIFKTQQNITRGSSKTTDGSLAKTAVLVWRWTCCGVLQWQHWGTWHLILAQSQCQPWLSD